jgi:hypothetical protein
MGEGFARKSTKLGLLVYLKLELVAGLLGGCEAERLAEVVRGVSWRFWIWDGFLLSILGFGMQTLKATAGRVKGHSTTFIL